MTSALSSCLRDNLTVLFGQRRKSGLLVLEAQQVEHQSYIAAGLNGARVLNLGFVKGEIAFGHIEELDHRVLADRLGSLRPRDAPFAEMNLALGDYGLNDQRPGQAVVFYNLNHIEEADDGKVAGQHILRGSGGGWLRLSGRRRDR